MQFHQALVGEWCLGNHNPRKGEPNKDELRAFYHALADRSNWDLRTCIVRGWLGMSHGR
ncbi:MAG: hypothetical protein Q4D48_07085 [Coriobacteriales bacterium]|nr:hypothetical protein [Coriobacteriales bacterium]